MRHSVLLMMYTRFCIEMWNRSKGLSKMSSLPDSSVIEAEKWFILHGRVDHGSKMNCDTT